jgi:hypothetical protein
MGYTLRLRQTVTMEVEVEVQEATSPEEAKATIERPEEMQDVPFKDGEVVVATTVAYSWQDTEAGGEFTKY